MKRVLCFCLCLLALTASALAVEDDFTYWDGDQLLTGMEARLAAEQAALNASLSDNEQEPAPEIESEPVPEAEPKSTPIESAGAENEAAPLPPLAADNDDKYPIGSYVDPAGNVWSPSGELLSPGTAPALEPAEMDPPEAESIPPAAESAVYSVADLRTAPDSSGDSLVGLKALIVSIFGEYTPVMTTAAITETVNGETTTTLVDVVADGAAGVDYEWIAGVFLFGLLLFCMMKLLGGVVK